MKIYVNWEDQEILSSKDFNKMVMSQIQSEKENHNFNDFDSFVFEFYENYDGYDILKKIIKKEMTINGVIADYETWLENRIKKDFKVDFEEVEI